MSARRAVVTGIGLVTPLADGREASWSALLAGASGVKPGGAKAPFDEVPEPRAIHFARRAAEEALRDAGVEPPLGERAGVSLSASKPLMDAPVLIWPEGVPHLLAWELGAGGPVVNFISACATGVQSVAAAAAWIAEGRCDAVLAGAAESSLVPLYEAGFGRMGVLSKTGRVRPFDRARDGFVMGEGAAALWLEEESRARARGARVYGAVTGWASASDAHHAARFNGGGRRMAEVVRAALRRAGLAPADVDYVNAHGTATRLNDQLEARALAEVFGGGRTLVSSTKGATGHLLGATGAVELAFSLLALRDGAAPPTLHLEDPETDLLDFVPQKARRAPLRRAASASFGFGGALAAAVVEA